MPTAPPSAPSVFIFHGRCGSTLLQQLLFDTQQFQLYGEPPPGENDFVDKLANQLETISDNDVGQRLAKNFGAQNFLPHKTVLSKHPNYAFMVDILDRVFPSCRIICLERSVLDIIRSTVAAGWIGNVRQRYIENAPGVKRALLADFTARAGQGPPDHDVVWVALYTAFRCALARDRLAKLPAHRYLRLEFIDWMENFEARSQEILGFLQLEPSLAATWSQKRQRAVQHTARSVKATGQEFGRLTAPSYQTPLCELAPELTRYINFISDLYGLADLPRAGD